MPDSTISGEVPREPTFTEMLARQRHDIHPATPMGSPPVVMHGDSVINPREVIDRLAAELATCREQLARPAPPPPPPQRAAMTPGQAAEVSPGRAACEAFWDAAGEARADIAWQWAGNQMTRKAWDAAAQAAVTAGTARILAEAARYKAERDALAADLATRITERNAARDERDGTSRIVAEHMRSCHPREDREFLNAINEALREGGNEYPLGVRGVQDVITQRDGYLDELKEAQTVAAEMLAHWEYIGTTRDDDKLIAGWRERLGMDA